MNNKSEVL